MSVDVRPFRRDDREQVTGSRQRARPGGGAGVSVSVTAVLS